MVKERSFWDRLQEAMGECGMETDNLSAAARLVDAHYSSATKWKDGGLPRMKHAVKLATKTGVCVEWLLTGRGPKRSTDTVPEDMESLVSLWPQMNAETRKNVIGYAKLQRTIQDSNEPERTRAFEKDIAHTVHEPGAEYGDDK